MVAGLIDELELVEQINEYLGEDPREKVSAGVVVKAMLLNGLGCVATPLYLFEKFFEGKATEHLLGEGVLAEHLNDDRLGKVLEQLYTRGLSPLFVGICSKAAQKYKIKQQSAHLDSTSFAVEGEYNSGNEVVVAGAPVPIQITYGYSRDRRADLKQFMMNLVCWGDGDIPAFIELADGNQSDKVRFAGLLKEFHQQWDFEGLFVADAALYSEENLQEMVGLKWLSRVPLSIKAAAELVSDISESAFHPAAQQGYRLASVGNSYGGVKQRWVVVESHKRQESDRKQLEKKLATATSNAQAQLKKLSAQEFACEPDALAALAQLESRLSWHQLHESKVIARPHYSKRGKPKATDLPSSITYQVEATLSLDTEKVTLRQHQAGRFILATNDLNVETLSDNQLLQEYKQQQGAERGFRFLKDPMFLTSSIFLKSPERIMAMGLIMGLCLLVYNLGQRQLRQALQQAKQTLPNQLGKATQSPTLRWIFQCFMAVHLVVINGVKQVANLTDERQHILQFFNSKCKQYYLLL